MKNKQYLRITALALALCLGLSAAACGKKDKAEDAQQESTEETQEADGSGNGVTSTTSYAGQQIWSLPDPELAAFAASYSSLNIVQLDYVYYGEAVEHYETGDKALIDSVFRALDLIHVDQETQEYTLDADERFVFTTADGTRYMVRFNNRNYEVGRQAFTVTGDGELWKLARKIEEAGLAGTPVEQITPVDAAQAGADTGADDSLAALQGAVAALQQQAALLTIPSDGSADSGDEQAAAADDAQVSSQSAQTSAAAGLAAGQIGLVDGQLIISNSAEGPVYVPAESVYSEPYAMLVYYAEPYYGQVGDDGNVRISLREDTAWPYVDVLRVTDDISAEDYLTLKAQEFDETHAENLVTSPAQLTALNLENGTGYISLGVYDEGGENRNVLSIAVDAEPGVVVFTACYDDADTDNTVIAAENALALTEINGVAVAQ